MLSSVLYAIAAAAAIAAAFFCLYLYFQRRPRQDLVYDNSAFFLMFGSSLIFGGMLIYLLLTQQTDVAPIPAVVCVLCLLGFVSWHNEIIVFDDEGFTRRDILLRTRRYSYQDVTECSERIFRESRKRREVLTLFHTGDTHFSLSRKAVNYRVFGEYLCKYGREGIDP